MNTFRNNFAKLNNFIRHKSVLPDAKLRKIKIGQPTADSHPHLINAGEIVPGIKPTEFQERRQKLVNSVLDFCSKAGVNIKTHVLIIPSSTKKYMSDNIPYIFRQNTDYLYLSGCLEPDTCLLINTKPDSNDFFSTLFVRNSDNHAELWDGPRTDPDSASYLFGVDHALPISDFIPYLYSIMPTNKDTMIWFDPKDNIQPTISKLIWDIHSQNTSKIKLESLKKFIHNIRLIKSPAEIKLIEKSCNIASSAINRTIAFSRPGMSEHEIFTKVDYECRMKGAEYLAYPPVVAGGSRATIIHYINNNQIVLDGSMVLMDAGCEYHSYTSDITRTWPINGKFSPEQRLLYEVVYNVQSELINTHLMKNDRLTLDQLFNIMSGLLGKRLQEVGLISKTVSADQLFKMTYEFCPHHVSHYLGMDVHDTHLIRRNIPLVPGMVITVEPGVYISPQIKVDPKLYGIGIRIEDDILITENGPVVLTKNCVKHIDDIELVMKSSDNLIG